MWLLQLLLLLSLASCVVAVALLSSASVSCVVDAAALDGSCVKLCCTPMYALNL